jgi:hypothetical protein
MARNVILLKMKFSAENNWKRLVCLFTFSTEKKGITQNIGIKEFVFMISKMKMRETKISSESYDSPLSIKLNTRLQM